MWIDTLYRIGQKMFRVDQELKITRWQIVGITADIVSENDCEITYELQRVDKPTTVRVAEEDFGKQFYDHSFDITSKVREQCDAIELAEQQEEA